MGMFNNSLSAEQAVIMAFAQKQVLDIKLGADTPRQNGNVLYYVPVSIGISGHVAFSADLMRSSVVEADAQFFSKDRFFLSLGNGTATMAYRPIPFDGTLTATRIGIDGRRRAGGRGRRQGHRAAPGDPGRLHGLEQHAARGLPASP